MAKISERLLSTNKLRHTRRDSFDLQRVNLLGEDSICMVNFMVNFLSIEHENQNVVTIGTLLHQFMLNMNVLLASHSVCHVLDRDKTRSLGNKML